jgi:mannose-1-phosphate guanylyltransferase
LRLWPLSRWNKPKQFLRLSGEQSLMEATLLRCQNEVFDPSRPIIVGPQGHGVFLKQTIDDIVIKADIVLESDRRDSCAAIVAGMLVGARRNPDALIMVMAADHTITDATAFAAATFEAAVAAREGDLVTFGVKLRHPAIGYGYILPGPTLAQSAVCNVSRFVEKPELQTAEYYVKNGYLWNSGTFLFSIKSGCEEISALAPEIYAAPAKPWQKPSSAIMVFC